MSETAILDFSSIPQDAPPPEAAPPPAAETEISETQESAGAAEQQQQQQQQTAGQPVAQPTLKEMRAALKDYVDANPGHKAAIVKMLDNVGRYDAFSQIYKTVEDAREAAATLESIGGPDGLAEMQSTLASVEETDRMLESGDPKIIDDIFEDAPEGIVRLAPHYLNKLEQVNPQALEAAVQPHLVRRLASDGFEDALGVIFSGLRGDPDETQLALMRRAVNSMVEWWNGQKSSAQNVNADSLAPERQRLSAKERELEEKDAQNFAAGVRADTEGYMNRELGRRLRPYLEFADMKPAQKAAVARYVLERINDVIAKQESRIAAMMQSKSRDRQKIANYINAQVAGVADGIVQKAVDEFALKPVSKKPEPRGPGGGASATPRGVVFVDDFDRGQIDFEKTSDEMMMRGQRMYKDGRIYQRRKPQA